MKLDARLPVDEPPRFPGAPCGWPPSMSKRRLPLRAFLLAVFALVPGLSCAQGDSINTPGSVEGRVFCDDTGFPARNAGVSLLAIDETSDSAHSQKRSTLSQTNTITDFDGHYIFRSVPPGLYYVLPRLTGYVDKYEIIQSSLSGLSPEKKKELLASLPQVTVRGGSAHKDVVLQRGAAITGRVLVDTGGPLIHQPVTATMVDGPAIDSRQKDGIRQPVVMWRARQNTDDRGVYRLAGLPEGKYEVQVDARMGRDTGAGLITVYAPGSIKQSDAGVIGVDDGDEISDIDITIPLGSLHSIGGIVTRGGNPLAGASISVTNGDGEESEFESQSDGTWRADLLCAGTYRIEAAYPSKNADVRQPQIKRNITVLLSDVDLLANAIDLSGSPAAK